MYIVTVETNFGSEVICTMSEVERSGRHSERIELTSYNRAREWIGNSQKEFPEAKYHLYELVAHSLVKGG